MQTQDIPNVGPVDPVKPGFKSSEFVAVATMAATNFIALLVLLGYVAPAESQMLGQAIGSLIASAAALVTNGLVVWKYVQSRTEVKTAATNAQANLQMERFNAALAFKQTQG